MNPHDPNHLRTRIDRLVDGDLSQDERRALLLDLDTRSDGWRLCALSFLEVQEWQLSTGSMLPSSDPPLLVVPKPAHERPFTRILAGAANLFIAFALGWTASTRYRPEVPAIAKASPIKSAPDHQTPETPSRDSALARNEVLEPPTEPPSEPAISQSILPPPLVGQLQRAGYEVEPQRGLVPVRLPDGHIVNIPVEGVQIRQVNRRTL